MLPVSIQQIRALLSQGMIMPYHVRIMTNEPLPSNRVRQYRTSCGITQAELAEKAGISRTAVTAIEGERQVPSVAAALALAGALGVTVEELFGPTVTASKTEVWAWNPSTANRNHWSAEVGGKLVFYPADSMPSITALPDAAMTNRHTSLTSRASETLVMASCDPAAGLLASQFNESTGLRLIVLHRSSQQAIEMLQKGLVHLAGLHFSTADDPGRNENAVRTTLGTGFQMLRMAQWQEGVAVSPKANLRSVKSVTSARIKWIGREVGSGARECLDRLLENRHRPRHIARNHRGVAEAIRSGWAEAGVCVQLVSAEAGLVFLPVQEEAFDLCYPAALSEDRRIKAFVSVVRSSAYRMLLAELPGYDTSETGTVWEATP